MADDRVDGLEDIDPAPAEKALLFLAALTGLAKAVKLNALALNRKKGLGALFPGGAVGNGVIDVLWGAVVRFMAPESGAIAVQEGLSILVFSDQFIHPLMIDLEVEGPASFEVEAEVLGSTLASRHFALLNPVFDRVNPKILHNTNSIHRQMFELPGNTLDAAEFLHVLSPCA